MALRQYPYGRAAPGRVNTFFNSPYAAQIANNLSAAIYGDPRDELVREQIKNAQASRARQAEQDAIAAEDKARERRLNDELGAALATGGDLTKAIPSYIQGGGSLGDALTLMGMADPRYRQRLGLQDDSQAHAVGMQDDAQSHAVGMQDDAQAHAIDLEDMRHWNTLFRDDQRHTNAVDLATLQYDWRDSDREDTQAHQILRDQTLHGYDRERDQYKQVSDFLGDAFSEGYYLPDVANAPGVMPEGVVAPEDLSGALLPTADPTDPRYTGSSRSTAATKPPGASEANAANTLLQNAMDTMFGENWSTVLDDPNQYREMLGYLQERLAATNNGPQAVQDTLSAFNFSHTPGETGIFSDTPESLSIERISPTPGAASTGQVSQQAFPGAPPAGSIVNGYRFLGGDPNDEKNWIKQ